MFSKKIVKEILSELSLQQYTKKNLQIYNNNILYPFIL